MCRFTYYSGPPLALSALVTEPEHSLIRQSLAARERDEPTNGDGFGVAWYPVDGPREPGLFRSITPAWNNQNLASLARAVRSPCILAHVRAATQVREVGEANCHPFVAGRYAFMHNGDLGGFERFRRRLLEGLSDEAFAALQGRTDSEHLFALFLDRVGGPRAEVDAAGLADALRGALADGLALSERHGGGEPSYLNVVVTDGRHAVCTRFTNERGSEGESLYRSTGRRYVCEGGACRMIAPDSSEAAVIVSSERLSDDAGWEAIPPNYLVVVGPDRTVRAEPIALARRAA